MYAACHERGFKSAKTLLGRGEDIKKRRLRWHSEKYAFKKAAHIANVGIKALK
jgi:hypothetical protein